MEKETYVHWEQPAWCIFRGQSFDFWCLQNWMWVSRLMKIHLVIEFSYSVDNFIFLPARLFNKKTKYKLNIACIRYIHALKEYNSCLEFENTVGLKVTMIIFWGEYLYFDSSLVLIVYQLDIFLEESQSSMLNVWFIYEVFGTELRNYNRLQVK